jgi:glycosyltransferase involved in cell wall biosynthesis
MTDGPDRTTSRPLRIVMVIPYDPFYQPFVIRSIRFAEELMRRGHTVRYHYAPMRPSRRGNAVRDSLPAGLEALALRARDGAAIEALRQDIRVCDVVHFQKSKPPHSWLALSLARLHGKPVHQDWDDDEFAFWAQTTRDRLGALSLRAPSSLGETAKAVIVAGLSGATERLIPRLVDTVGGASMELRRKSAGWGCEPSAVFPAQVGVDGEVFSPARRDEALRRSLGLDGPTVLYAGSFDVRPDLEFFVRALRALVAQARDARCLVVGGGFGRERFVAGLREAGLEHAVRMTPGLVTFADMPRYVASCDIAALPFRDNAVNRSKSSLTLIECMSSGLPVVTHDVGDIGWMLGPGGIVAPPGDADAFAAKLAELARDPAQRAKLGAAGRARTDAVFRWSRTVDYLEAAYEHAIASHARRSRARNGAAEVRA